MCVFVCVSERERGVEKKKVMVVMLKRTRISSIFSPKKDTVVEKEPVDRGCFFVFFSFLVKFMPAVTSNTQRVDFTSAASVSPGDNPGAR